MHIGEFMSNVNNEILSFLEEGPSNGVGNLRTGLEHNLGVIDPRIVEVCTTDANVPREVGEQRRQNRSPSLIYTHYFYLRKRPGGAEQYLLARLTDSVAVESALAAITCIASELAAAENDSLARALIVSCVTTMSKHTLRDYSEMRETIKVYRGRH
jgi:hypothetical protein